MTDSNQPPPFEGRNLYLTDRPLQDAVAHEGAAWAHARLAAWGSVLGRAVRKLVEIDLHGSPVLAFQHLGDILIDQPNAVVSDTYTISPTLINEFRVGFNRRKTTKSPDASNQDWAKQVGIPGVSGASFPFFPVEPPVDAGIVGIVDHWTVEK